jgi:Dyp-type peroxidase family
MPLDLELNFGPIDQNEPNYADVLEDLQGNILNGHGRDHGLHLFLAFDQADRIEDLKKWIAGLAKEHITSAKAQLDGTEAYKSHKLDAGMFTHFALSASGYVRLGTTPENLPQRSNPQNRSEDVFPAGMKSRQAALLDTPVSTWEEGFQTTIDAVLILADDNPAELIARQLEIQQQLLGIASIVNVERGFTLRRKFETVDMTNPSNEFGTVVEHFGYADGVSQPIFLQKQYQREKDSKGTKFWDPAAPLKLVLVPDPLGKQPGVTSFGSFLVFRKLEQNVKGFKTAEAKLGEALGLPQELVGAMAVGRYEDGSPIVLQPGDGAWANTTKPAIPNDFNYKGDSLGLVCPFHAHVRKSNPRLESVKKDGPFAQSKEEELGHRIARRGIPYGGPLSSADNLDDLPTQGVGLLFICYQSDIWEQFEFIQRFWCNNPLFLEPGFSGGSNPNYDLTGLDAVIGQKQGEQADPAIGQAPNPPQNWPKQWGKATVKPEIPPENQFGQFVTLKGGEYFFSPSISFLANLA